MTSYLPIVIFVVVWGLFMLVTGWSIRRSEQRAAALHASESRLVEDSEAEVATDQRADLADYLADKTSRVVDLPALVKAQMMRDDPDSYFAAVRGERAAEVEEGRR